MKRLSNDGNFKVNFSRGGKVEPYYINNEIEWLAIESSKILKLDIAGVDLLFSNDGFKICEVNSAPGFQGLESCCNVNIPKEIYNFIKIYNNK